MRLKFEGRTLKPFKGMVIGRNGRYILLCDTSPIKAFTSRTSWKFYYALSLSQQKKNNHDNLKQDTCTAFLKLGAGIFHCFSVLCVFCCETTASLGKLWPREWIQGQLYGQENFCWAVYKELEYEYVYRILVGKPEGQRPLGRPKWKWVDNIKMDLSERGLSGVGWVGLAQDR
jgi:hypothetical protein